MLEVAPDLMPAEVRSFIQDYSTSMGGSGHDFTTAHGLANFNESFQAVQASLPATLTHFEATVRQNRVIISWETEVEDNLAAFVVDRSENNTNFQETKVLSPKGGGSFYQTEITNLTYGWHYFRLRFEDIDGTINYSPVIRVNLDGTDGTFAVIVQDQGDELTFFWGGDHLYYKLSLYDLKGRNIGNWKGHGNHILVNKNTVEHPVVVYQLEVMEGQALNKFSGKLSF